MDFMTTVREKATQIAQGAVKTSGAVMETVKSNFAIADKEAETVKIFRELGTMVYNSYKNGEELDAEETAAKCAALDEYFDEIAALREKLSDLKNTKTCPKCKAKVKAEFKFCPVCGEKMD